MHALPISFPLRRLPSPSPFLQSTAARTQLDFERGQLARLQDKAKQLADKMVEDAKRHKEAEAAAEAATGAAAEADAAAGDLAAQADALRAQAAELEGRVADMQAAAADVGRRTTELRRAAGTAAAAAEGRAAAMLDVVNGARLEQVGMNCSDVAYEMMAEDEAGAGAVTGGMAGACRVPMLTVELTRRCAGGAAQPDVRTASAWRMTRAAPYPPYSSAGPHPPEAAGGARRGRGG